MRGRAGIKQGNGKVAQGRCLDSRLPYRTLASVPEKDRTVSRPDNDNIDIDAEAEALKGAGWCLLFAVLFTLAFCLIVLYLPTS